VTTVPLGQDPRGLPIGAQIIGPRVEDHTTIAFAGLLERGLGYGFIAPGESTNRI
jgi:amidase